MRYCAFCNAEIPDGKVGYAGNTFNQPFHNKVALYCSMQCARKGNAVTVKKRYKMKVRH